MPPSRIRNPFDDSRSESSGIREKQPSSGLIGPPKARRNVSSMLSGSTLKDVTNAQNTRRLPVPTESAASVQS